MYHKISFNQSVRWDLSNKKTSFQPYPHIFADSSRLRGGKLLSPNVDCRRWIALRWNTNNNRQHSLIFADLQQQKKDRLLAYYLVAKKKKNRPSTGPVKKYSVLGSHRCVCRLSSGDSPAKPPFNQVCFTCSLSFSLSLRGYIIIMMMLLMIIINAWWLSLFLDLYICIERVCRRQSWHNHRHQHHHNHYHQTKSERIDSIVCACWLCMRDRWWWRRAVWLGACTHVWMCVCVCNSWLVPTGFSIQGDFQPTKKSCLLSK